MAEVVAGPLAAGRQAQAEQYRMAMLSGPGVTFVPLGDDAAVLAGRLRIGYRLKLPNAFQLAAGALAGCQALPTIATFDRSPRFGFSTPIAVVDPEDGSSPAADPSDP